jgi:hypothetical protein
MKLGSRVVTRRCVISNHSTWALGRVRPQDFLRLQPAGSEMGFFFGWKKDNVMWFCRTTRRARRIDERCAMVWQNYALGSRSFWLKKKKKTPGQCYQKAPARPALTLGR